MGVERWGWGGGRVTAAGVRGSSGACFPPQEEAAPTLGMEAAEQE